MRNLNCAVLSGANTSNINGASVDAGQLYSASFQVVNNDSLLAGTIKVQMSNDVCAFGNVASSFIPTRWTDIPSASITMTAGVASGPIILTQMSYRWIRVVMTQTTPGNTTVVVNINAQGF